MIGQADAEVGLVSLLGVLDPQGEDVVSLDHQVLAALEHRLCVPQPLGSGFVCVHLAVQDDLLALFGFRVLQWCDDLQFFYGKNASDTEMRDSNNYYYHYFRIIIWIIVG